MKKSKRNVEPAKKKSKMAAAAEAATRGGSKRKGGGLSSLLGKRRSATEASERIARVTQAESKSTNSSDNDDNSGPSGERQSTRLRAARSSRTQLKEKETQPTVASSRLSADNAVTGSSRSKRRRAVDNELLSMFNVSFLEDLLNNMMKHRDGWPFDRPITKSDAPDYFSIIERPMDLGTIRSSVLNMKYSCNQEVIDDIRLVFKNCWRYNKSDAEEYQCGVRLEKYFLKEAKKNGLIEPDEEPSAPELDAENQPLAKRARKTL